jgi:hyperosmotically inducible protein
MRHRPTVDAPARGYDGVHVDHAIRFEEPSMKTNASQRAALAVALSVLALAGCDRQSTEQAKRDATDAGRKVESALERTGEKIADATRKAAAEVKATASEARTDATHASSEAKSSDAGRVLSDSAITASIKTDYLKDPDLSVLKIDVDTRDGVVTLNGMAGTDEGRKRAVQLAGAIKGVKEVRDHLTVKQG